MKNFKNFLQRFIHLIEKNNNSLGNFILNEIWLGCIVNPLLGLRFKVYYKLGWLKSEKELDKNLKRNITFFDDFTKGFDNNVWKTHFSWGRNHGDFMWWDDDCVNIVDNKLVLSCQYDPQVHKDYTGERKYDWKCGMVHTEEFFNQRYGRWVAKMKLPNIKGAFPAFWTLHRAYRPNNSENIIKGKLREDFSNDNKIKLTADVFKQLNINVYCVYKGQTLGKIQKLYSDAYNTYAELNQIVNITIPKGDTVDFVQEEIIPEIDIMEYFYDGKKNLKVQTNLHFGYSNTEYRKYNCGHGINNIDLSKRFHTFEVEWSKKSYKFYIDGLLLTIRKYKQALSDNPCYIILNNGILKDIYLKKEMGANKFDVEVDWVKVYGCSKFYNVFL